MSNHHLLILPADIVHEYISPNQRTISLNHIATHLQVDDRILPIRTAEREVILPYVYRIASINHTADTATLQLEELYNRTATTDKFSELDSIKKNFVQQGALRVTRDDFNFIVDALGGKRKQEKALLDYIQKYITARGYYFDQETLYNYHICLKTRPFVILAGLSGTGKSKLSQLYAEALGHKPRYLRLPVRPNWNDDRYLLGHLNTITGEYVTAPAVEFVLNAIANEDNLYFFCLDEMNLAHIEYYFSQFLSAMEEELPEDRQIFLLSESEQKFLEEKGKINHIPARLRIPTNLFFTGTINVDETTQPISDKVIDRANTLEFFSVDLDKIPQPSVPPDPITLSTFVWQSYQIHESDKAYRDQIIAINKMLNKADLGLGYRVLHEIELYLANSKDLLEPHVAFDLQIKQRILPRVRGTETIRSTLNDLQTFFKRNRFLRSEQRLDEMIHRLDRDGYTGFWR
jgi:hypothetical protein